MHPVFDTRIFKKECSSLANSGYNVILVAPHTKEEEVEGVKIIPLEKHASFYDRLFIRPRKAIEKIKNIDADLFHFHDPELIPYMASFARKYNKKVIWDAHENYKDTIRSFNSFKFKPLSYIGAILFNFFELRLSKNNFSGVVTITDRMAEKYKKKGIRTCVLNNYADISQFKYNGIADLSKKPRLISAGAQFEARAIEEIADSFKEIKKSIPNAEIHFTGKFTTERLQNKVNDILKKTEPTGEDYKVEGFVPFDYMINVAVPKAWATVILFDITDPNNRNSMTNRFFEAWGNGVPIITTKGTLTAEIIEEVNGGIIIDNNHPTSIAEAFIKIASNKAYREKLSKNGFEAVKNKYNWNRNFQDLKQLYAEVLDEKK